MNLGDAVGKVANAAGGTANGVSQAANVAGKTAGSSGVIANTTNQVSNSSNIITGSNPTASSKAVILDSSGRPLNSSNEMAATNATIVDSNGNPISSASSNSDSNIEIFDDETGSIEGTDVNNNTSETMANNQENEEGQELSEGDKVAPGKEIDENGEVDKTSTRKLTEAVGRGAAAYFTGGQSIGTDKAIVDSRLGDHLLGVVSDTAERVPGVEQVADELSEAGVTDAVNDALDTVGSAKNMDVKGAVEGAKKTVKDVDKFKKYAVKKIVMILLPPLLFLLLIVLIIVVVLGPIIGGFMDLTDGDSESKSSGGGYVSSSNSNTNVANLLADTPNYSELTPTRQAILAAAASLVGMSYNWGGHPTGPGLSGFPITGLDCAGYVQWVLWTALDANPGYLTTSSISSQIGTRFIEVSADELQPGDIGLKRRGGSTSDDTNHTGIYAGNGQWYHALSSNTGIVKNNYSSFTIYLRYVSVV